MRYKLIIEEATTLNTLKTEVANGGKFKIYPYCISLFLVVTLKRLSPAIFIKSGESDLKFRRKYNRLSYFLGWWGIPWGVMYTINYTRLNRKGGIDVTDDVMLNIDENSLANNEVKLKTTSLIFAQPEKNVTKTFEKVFNKMSNSDSVLSKVIVGRFLNMPHADDYLYVIGIELSREYKSSIERFMTCTQQITKELYRDFSKRVTFEIIDLDSNNELTQFLIKQGKEYLNK